MERYTVNVIQARGANALAHVYDNRMGWNERVCSGPDAVETAQTLAAELNATAVLPNPNVTGPCQIQSSILCKPSEGAQRLNPMDMLNINTAFTSYTMCCLPCYEHQADLFISKTYGRSVKA